MTTNTPDAKLDDDLIGYLRADLATVTKQRDKLLAACTASLPIVESISARAVHYLKPHAEAAEEKLRSAIAACEVTQGER